MENQSLRLGPYTDLSYIGKGSFVCVYRALDQFHRPVALRFVFRGGEEQLEQYIKTVAIDPAGGSLSEQHKASSDEIDQAESEVGVLRALSGKCSVVPQVYAAHFAPNWLLPDIPIIAMELVTEPEIKLYMDKALQKGRSPVIPEVYALEMARQTLEALDLLHKEGRHLFDAQMKNYRAAIPDDLVEFPTRPDGLSFHLLDWNGTLTLEQSKTGRHLASPQGFDVWMAFAFLFEMLTGASVVERREGLSAHRLMRLSGSHWEQISPGTRGLLRYVLAFERGRHAVDVGAICGWLAHRLKVWASQGIGLRDELEQVPYYLDFTEEAAWLARVFPNNPALAQQKEDLSKNRARLEEAARTMLQKQLHWATRYPQTLPEHVLTLDELRNKIIINTLRNDESQLQGNDLFPEIADALGRALSHISDKNWEALDEHNPLKPVCGASDAVRLICGNLGLESRVRVTWNNNPCLHDLVRNPYHISEWTLDEIAGAHQALEQIGLALQSLQWPADAQNSYSDRIACELLGQSWQPASEDERPAHIAQLTSLAQKVAAKENKLKTLQAQYDSLWPADRAPVDEFKEIVANCPDDFREHPIHFKNAQKIAAKLEAASVEQAAYFVQGVFNSLPWGPEREQFAEDYRPYRLASEILSMLQYSARDAQGEIRTRLQELRHSEQGTEYLLKQLNAPHIYGGHAAGSSVLGEGVFELIEQAVKDSGFQLGDLWGRWKSNYFAALKDRLQTIEDYSETRAALKKISEANQAGIPVDEILQELDTLHRIAGDLSQSQTGASRFSNTATAPSTREYANLNNALDTRDRADKILQRVITVESKLRDWKLGWLRCVKASAQEQLVENNKRLIDFDQRLRASHDSLDMMIGTMGELPPQFDEKLAALGGLQGALGEHLGGFKDQQGRLDEIGSQVSALQQFTEHVNSLVPKMSRHTNLSIGMAVAVLIATGALAIILAVSLNNLHGAVDDNTAALAAARTYTAQQMEGSIATVESLVAQHETEISQAFGEVSELHGTLDALQTPTDVPNTPEPTPTSPPTPTSTEEVTANPTPDTPEVAEVAAVPVPGVPDEVPELADEIDEARLSAPEMENEPVPPYIPLPDLTVRAEASDMAGRIKVTVELTNRAPIPLTEGELRLALVPSVTATTTVPWLTSDNCLNPETLSGLVYNGAFELSGITLAANSDSTTPCVITIELVGLNPDAEQFVILFTWVEFTESSRQVKFINLNIASGESAQQPVGVIEQSENIGGSGD